MLAMVVLLTMPMQALAQEQTGFVDMPNNWSTEALTKAVENGLLSGYNGRLHPNHYLTRAEMATILNRAFRATEHVDISNYTDVKPTDWFYDDMSKAVGMGLFKGYANQLRPNDFITREEVFGVLSNAFSLKAEEANKEFVDSHDLSPWALESVNGMVNGGYISGSNGKLNPKANITRAEFAQVMHNIIKHYVHKATTYEEINAGNVIVNTPNATLRNVTIKGDLIIAEGVGEGEVTLDNVKVEGRLLVRAGGDNSILIKGDSEIESIIIVKQGNKVRIFNETGKEIAVTTIEGTADVILEGAFKNVIVQSPDIIVYAQNTEIENIEINGTRSRVIVDQESEIEKVVVKAAHVVIEGKGTVKSVEVSAGGSGTQIITSDTLIDVDKAANDVVGTGGVEIEPNITYVNGTTETQNAKPLQPPTTSGTTTTYLVNFSVVGDNGTLTATRTNGSRVSRGTSVTFTATPNESYEIKEWKVNGEIVESGSLLTRTVNSNTTVTVEFKEIVVEPTMYTVTYSVIGTGGTLEASVPNGGTAQEGSSVDFTAIPDEGYRLKEWTVNGEVIDWLTGLNVSRDMNMDVDFKVAFEPIESAPIMFTVTYEVVGDYGGTIQAYEGNSLNPTDNPINSGDEVEIGTELRLISTPDEHKQIREIKINNGVVMNTNVLDVAPVMSDIHITVEFETIEYTLNFSVLGENGSITATSTTYATVTNGMKVYRGTSLRFESVPDDGYRIKDWEINGLSYGPTLAVELTFVSEDTTVTLEFEPINNAPVAVDDSATVNEDATVLVDVLANDTDVDGDTLSITSFTQGQYGSVTREGDSLRYAPNTEFREIDSFEYEINDGNGGTDTATVNIIVNITSALQNLYSFNYSETSGEFDFSFTLITEGVYVFETSQYIEPCDTVMYMYDSNNNLIAMNDNYIDSYATIVIKLSPGDYILSVEEKNLQLLNTTFTIYLKSDTEVNDTPVAVDDTVTVNEDSTVLIDVLANDTDADGDTLSITGFTQGTNGTVTQEGDSLRYTPNPNFYGSDSFMYEISDGNGGIATAIVSITVNPI